MKTVVKMTSHFELGHLFYGMQYVFDKTNLKLVKAILWLIWYVRFINFKIRNFQPKLHTQKAKNKI